MIPRLVQLPPNKHCFLFGPRNTGKSTLILQTFGQNTTLWLDLLDTNTETRFSRDPEELYRIVVGLSSETTHVVIDEIQKVPKLLDVVQRLMRDVPQRFIMTGSSARKLKLGGANLLAGRAFVYYLFPFTFIELDNQVLMTLDTVLQWGTLPEILLCVDNAERQAFLNAYAHTYIKEEIWGEQIIRKLEPFRRFLEVAAQCNGKIINFSNIAKDVGVDDKTVKSYYAILEDTLLGFFLESYHHSFRKRLSHKPKFYFFDTGVTRALARLSTVSLVPKTSAYGNAFEHFIILECWRLSHYYNQDYRLSYLMTSSDVEIDLIVERPGKPLLCIEIKSNTNVMPIDISAFIHLTKTLPNCEAVCFCDERYEKKIEHITVLPWKEGVQRYFKNYFQKGIDT